MVALVVLLGAILPSVTYIGHWTIRGPETATAQASADGHAIHCHGSSACADQVGYALEWLTDSQDALILDGGSERALAPEQAPSHSDPVIVPLDPPPQYA